MMIAQINWPEAILGSVIFLGFCAIIIGVLIYSHKTLFETNISTYSPDLEQINNDYPVWKHTTVPAKLTIKFVKPPETISKDGDYLVMWNNGETEIFRFDAGDSTEDVDRIFGPISVEIN